MIKSFRGRIADNGTEQIRLSTNNGLTGYKINKLQIIGTTPGANDIELVLQIFTTPRDTASGTVDFTDPTLLAVAYYADSNSIAYQGDAQSVLFDNMVFNQDIYLTAVDVQASDSTNYYLELEQIKLDINEATVATLKDMRGRE